MLHLLRTGNVDSWENMAERESTFPGGFDPLVQRRWIINAIDTGSAACVRWMALKGVDLNFRDKEGYTPLHAAIDRGSDAKYEILETLLRAGAPVNLQGFNEWTPAHLAAARDDVQALKLLVQFGANLSIRTDIDDFATPLEEAENLGSSNAANYIKTVF